ncbi:IncF plasmid conjugative transfer protein TraG [Hyphomicrobiales bacterium]|nr:IncF plasmid conjugative transfer protein TraG [Hyphomicrobiales bacterium]CAH1680589.1 IncF plasmid conjugative transfer protein TraG [Hyphomicrobiales bacterium]
MYTIERLPQASGKRIFVAFLFAPVLPAVVMGFILSSVFQGMTLLYGFGVSLIVGGYIPMLVVGIPIYQGLKRRISPKLLTCAAAGGAVASCPLLVLLLMGAPHSATVGDVATARNGVTTLGGWALAMPYLGGVFALGAIGGFVFWAIACLRRGRRTQLPEGYV